MSSSLETPLLDPAIPNTNENQNVTASKSKIKFSRSFIWAFVIVGICVIAIAGIVPWALGAYKATTRTTADTCEYCDDLIDADGVIGNPYTYPDMNCSMPNYISKNGQIYAVSTSSSKIEETPLYIKGVNWFGMESVNGMPLGLWENSQNGTSVYKIVKFLAENRYNSVRLPLSIDYLLVNSPRNLDMINQNANRAINFKSYYSTLRGLITALAYRHISVLFSFQTFLADQYSPLWYNDNIPESTIAETISQLAKHFCNNQYWNVIGIDLRNEPSKITWGDNNPATDFHAASIRLGNILLDACPQWMVFIEGTSEQHTLELTLNSGGLKSYVTYGDWNGANISPTIAYPVVLNQQNKVVYSPPYFSSSRYPQSYMFNTSTINNAELDDNTLYWNINATWMSMFGNVAEKYHQTVILSSYGGLYTKDLSPKKTSQRILNYIIQFLQKPEYGGGYFWALNPETTYNYNYPLTNANANANANTNESVYQEGLFKEDWKTPNHDYIKLLNQLNNQPNLHAFPCFS